MCFYGTSFVDFITHGEHSLQKGLIVKMFLLPLMTESGYEQIFHFDSGR